MTVHLIDLMIHLHGQKEPFFVWQWSYERGLALTEWNKSGSLGFILLFFLRKVSVTFSYHKVGQASCVTGERDSVCLLSVSDHLFHVIRRVLFQTCSWPSQRRLLSLCWCRPAVSFLLPKMALRALCAEGIQLACWKRAVNLEILSKTRETPQSTPVNALRLWFRTASWTCHENGPSTEWHSVKCLCYFTPG